MKTEQEPDLRIKPTVHDQCGSKNINDTGSANRSKRVNQDEAQRRGSLWRSAAGGFFARNYMVGIAPRSGSARHWSKIEERIVTRHGKNQDRSANGYRAAFLASKVATHCLRRSHMSDGLSDAGRIFLVLSDLKCLKSVGNRELLISVLDRCYRLRLAQLRSSLVAQTH